MTEQTSSPKSFWFVGAAYGTEDQTERFLKDGIWQNGRQDRNLDEVRGMQPGDRIAIKSSYTRKYGLPFDNKGHTVSVMGIKAIGVVTHNHNDGRVVGVKWQPRLEDKKEWYFSGLLSTVHRVLPDSWENRNLIDFTFNNKSQDIDRFRNDSRWRDSFGDVPTDKQRFKWTLFYEEFADKLIAYKDRRQELMSFVSKLAYKFKLSYIKGKQLDDICPFTVFGLFNRGMTDENRTAIARDLAGYLGVEEAVPKDFDGVPTLHNQQSWFFGFEHNRQPSDIDTLWNFFAVAMQFPDSDNPDAGDEFSSIYDQVAGQYGIGWNLTMGLYWIRPWNYVTLDDKSRSYITNNLNIDIGKNGPGRHCNSEDYLEVLNELKSRFEKDAYPVHSFPELSLSALNYKYDARNLDHEENSNTYTIDNIIADGCFLERESIAKIIDQLDSKKNIILQGPPGTGKTWLAKKLGYALMGQKNDNHLRAVQFHPNLSYEDFVRGWRPSGEGKLARVDGPFLGMVKMAKKDARIKHVIVIEEINRGNPAQIFGEMLTLLEADKRTPKEALELSYPKDEFERVYIPENLYVIGTMNIADRSLALVDLALRRRFAFFNLQPIFGEKWCDWVHTQAGIDIGFLQKIERLLTSLNNEIASHKGLGPQFKIGHSYVTPSSKKRIKDATAWFLGIVEAEIGPLLEEYFFDDIARADKLKADLVEGIQ